MVSGDSQGFHTGKHADVQCEMTNDSPETRTNQCSDQRFFLQRENISPNST